MILGTDTKLDTPEAIAAWLEDRKKRWPSAKRVMEKVGFNFIKLLPFTSHERLSARPKVDKKHWNVVKFSQNRNDCDNRLIAVIEGEEHTPSEGEDAVEGEAENSTNSHLELIEKALKSVKSPHPTLDGPVERAEEGGELVEVTGPTGVGAAVEELIEPPLLRHLAIYSATRTPLRTLAQGPLRNRALIQTRVQIRT